MSIVRKRPADHCSLPHWDLADRSAPETQLESVADHLLELRVRNQKIVDNARVVGIGATELERRRRAVGHRVSRIEVDVRRDLVGQADRRIEVEEGRVAVEKSAVRALKIDPREIETRAAGQRQAVGRAERVERVEAGIEVGRMDRDRRQKAVRLVDQVGEADHRERRVVVVEECAELAVAGETRPAVVERRADRESVVVAVNLVRVDGLHGCRQANAIGSSCDRSRRDRASRPARYWG